MRRALLLLAACAHAKRVRQAAPPRQPFVVITTQRTGSAMLMEWLRQRDCVKTGLELFINHHHINNQTRRDAYVALLQGRVSESAGPKFQHFAADVGALNASQPVSYGFKWMLSQGVSDDFETWFGPIAIQHNVRLVFLRRWNVLRVYLSEESALMTTAHPSTHSNYSVPLIVLKSGPALIGQLVYYKKKMEDVESLYEAAVQARISSVLIYYESLVDDPETVVDLISGMLFDEKTKARFRTCGVKCASVKAAGVDCDDDGRKRDPERYAQIHGGGLDQYISNFGEVLETLSGHPVFGPYLDPLEPTRKRLEKHLAPKVALFDGSESHRASVATAPVSSSSPCDRWPRPYHCLASSRSGVGPRRRR